MSDLFNYKGIAGYVQGWAQEEISVPWEDEDGNVYFDHDFVDSDQFVEFVWVGDDTVQIVDIAHLVPVSDEESFCDICGVIGCDG
jgi:hypothetical protein